MQSTRCEFVDSGDMFAANNGSEIRWRLRITNAKPTYNFYYNYIPEDFGYFLHPPQIAYHLY